MMLSLLGVKLALDRQSVQAGFLFFVGCLGQSGLYIPDHFLLIVLGGRRDNAMLRMLIVGFGF